MQEQKPKNTQSKTKSNLNPWKKFCESLKESRAIENIPAIVLDFLLSKFSRKFFISVRKQNGTEYELGTFTWLPAKFSTLLALKRKSAKLEETNKQEESFYRVTPLERPVLDDFSKQTFSQTSLHS